MSVIRHPNTAGATLTQWRYTATGGETSLSGTDGFSTALSYTVGSEQVFINGVLLERGVDYAATTGTTITGLTALVANDIATVISPSSFNVANAIPKSTVTAKGDLLAATGASTVTNLPVGADGTTLVANSAATTGVSYTAGTVQSNPVLNSAMQVWQRGTSFAITTPAYTADRWQAGRSANAAGTTVSRQVTSDTTNLPNIQYCMRVQRDSGTSGTGTSFMTNSFETINSIPFAGKTVTFSVYARKGANYSATSNNLACIVGQGTGTDENYLTAGYTGVTSVINSNAVLTTTWQRFTFTGNVAAATTELAVQFTFNPTGTAGANDYYEITGVQIDIGSVALPFRTFSQTLQGELAACQRYYYRISTNAPYSWVSGIGLAYSTTSADVPIPFPVTMRTTSTAIDYANIWLTDDVATFSTGTFTNNGGYNNTQGNVRYVHGTAALTQYRPYFLQISTSGGYLGFTAEL